MCRLSSIYGIAAGRVVIQVTPDSSKSFKHFLFYFLIFPVFFLFLKEECSYILVSVPDFMRSVEFSDLRNISWGRGGGSMESVSWAMKKLIYWP